MTREEVTIQALRNHIEVLKERLTALEQEQKYCDRNICTSNEYNGIRCEECEVAKSQEHLVNESGNLVKDLVKDAISRQAVLQIFNEWFACCDIADKKASPKNKIKALSPVTPIHRDRTVQDFADKCRECGKQKKGKWVTKFHGFPPEPYTTCSNCDYDIDFEISKLVKADAFTIEPYRPNYCPNCGAEMESEE